ncbi:hypothetical protein Tco_0283151, partial [Tanacetum coccineum]
MASSASSSTKNPPRKLGRTNVIGISSNESLPIQKNNPIPTTLNTTLALSIKPPMISQTPTTQPIEILPLAPRALVFSTPIEPHTYLNSLDELPPRSSNPPPPPPTQGINQTLPQHTPMDFELTAGEKVYAAELQLLEDYYCQEDKDVRYLLSTSLTYLQDLQPTTTIPDSIPETSGGNLGGHSSSDKSILGNEGEMTLQSVYDLCLSLCAQVSDQAKEIQHLKAQITKLKKQAKPVIKHHRSWLKSVSLKQRFPSKSFSKKHRVHKESVSKQGRKFAKGKSSVQRDPLFDEIPEDTVDQMETKNAQDEGRTRDIMDGNKEIEENVLSTEDVLSTDKDKVSTDEHNEGTEEHIEGTKEQVESTDGQRKGTEDHTEEEIATQATQTPTQTPTSTIFGDDETIAKVLLNMSQAKQFLGKRRKIDPKEKGKKKIEEEDESESESDGIPEAEKKFKQLESDEEMARKIQEEWEGKEERNKIAEEKAANEALIRNFDDIKA